MQLFQNRLRSRKLHWQLIKCAALYNIADDGTTSAYIGLSDLSDKQNKTGILPSYNNVSTIVWMHHLNYDEMLVENYTRMLRAVLNKSK